MPPNNHQDKQLESQARISEDAKESTASDAKSDAKPEEPKGGTGAYLVSF